MELSNALLASALIRIKNREADSIPADSEINHTFSNSFEDRMQILISSFDKKEKSTPVFRSTLLKAAVTIIIVCIGIFSLIMLNPQVRANFENAVMEFYENHIKFFFVTDNEEESEFNDYRNIFAEYIPTGFILKEKYDEYEAIGYRFENEKAGLSYDIYVSLNEGLAVHTDKNNVEQITINERDAYLISGKKDKKPYSTLIITDKMITVTIFGNLTRDEIINVGKSLKENK